MSDMPLFDMSNPEDVKAFKQWTIDNQEQPEQINEAAGAHKIYPRQGEESWPRTRAGEEKQAMREHVREVAEKLYGGTHPSSAEGSARVEQAVAAAEGRLKPTSIVGSE